MALSAFSIEDDMRTVIAECTKGKRSVRLTKDEQGTYAISTLDWRTGEKLREEFEAPPEYRGLYIRMIASLVDKGHDDLALQLARTEFAEAQDKPEMIERTYTVRTNNGEFLNRFEKLLAAIQTLGSWGASRMLKFSVDGDGSDRLHVDGLKEIGRSFNDLIDKDEVSVWDVKWADEEKK